jgi:hypothetical protein
MKEKRDVFLLCIIFAISALAILIVNSLGIPHENYILRATVTGLAQIAIFSISFCIIKNRTLRFALLAWLAAVLIWRIANVSGTLLRPLSAALFFAVFYIFIFISMWKEIEKKNTGQLIFFSLLMLAVVYFGFIFRQAFAIGYVFGIFDALVIAMSFVLIIQRKPALGYFMLAIADLTLLWQLRGQGYYVASWVEIIFVIAFFVLSAEKSSQKI